jgi:hypothetical protein
VQHSLLFKEPGVGSDETCELMSSIVSEQRQAEQDDNAPHNDGLTTNQGTGNYRLAPTVELDNPSVPPDPGFYSNAQQEE